LIFDLSPMRESSHIIGFNNLSDTR
jgi:hypothetical protein